MAQGASLPEASVPRTLHGDWSPASGYAAGEILASDPTVTAIFVANDQMALGVILALLATATSRRRRSERGGLR